MKLPNFKRIVKDDYPDKIDENTSFKAIIEKLGFSINTALETLVELSNHKISLSDNGLCVVKTIQVQVNSSGIPTAASVITLDNIVSRAIGTQVIRYINNTNSTGYATSGVIISYTQTGTSIRIDHITGLRAGDVYSLTVVVYG